MQVKTSELTPKQLDLLTAQLDPDYVWFDAGGRPFQRTDEEVDPRWRPSRNWAQGGPIIEREGISITSTDFSWWDCERGWYAHIGDNYQHGDTPLLAAMRCYVASKLGDTVEVPEGLL